MTKRAKKKKEILKKDRDALHLKLAYSLGRTAKKVSKTVAAVKKSAKGRLSQKRGSKGGKKLSCSTVADTPKEPMSPILKEIKAVADISGLTAAVEEMNEISLKHSNNPIIHQLTTKIEQLSPTEQEDLSRKFIDRLRSSSCFNQATYTFPSPADMTEEDCQKISDAFIDSVFFTLEDIGMTPKEREFLQKFSDDMTRPINDLVQFYLHPKTFSQKVKRLWRMQRIFIKMIKLIHMTNALAMANADGESILSNNWPPSTASVITVKGRTVK